MSCHVRSHQVRLGQVRSGYVRLGFPFNENGTICY